MNQDRFKLFSEAYRAALVIAVSEHPEKYTMTLYKYEQPEFAVKLHAQRILDGIETNPLGINYNGDSFKLVCKTLGIKYTRKAIFEWLEIKAK